MRLLRILDIEPDRSFEFMRGKGCDKCFHSGYSGRTGVFEVMKLDERLREGIVKNVPVAALKEMAISQGMNTLKASGIKKIKRGETTVEETLRVIL
ncbi:type IV pilus assembly protein PilB [Candidatus Moduliflexus flocculans]|uniref:Type IV pilus assembly protein PilB n=1 Tax=Candidatus Moduliflexus flocculans TaxID=1499966 RepID=A0A0S6VX45_9BACT|nr:type IV pilus assembly protein PilB [Candidatus Moduliflexus flocculans]